MSAAKPTVDSTSNCDYPLSGITVNAVFGEWLGHSDEELARYKADGVIGYSEEERGVKAEVI